MLETTSSPLPRSTPESTGVASSDILAFIDAVESADLELHSLILLRHGQVIAEGWWEPYKPEDVHFLYSLSKSFCSTAVGLAIAEGKLSLDDTVISFFPDETPANPSANLQAMKVRHLLSMSAGHAADDMSELRSREDGDWAKGFLAREVPYEPGTHFMYNTSATYMLSAILHRLNGEPTLDYLDPRLLDPLGIEKATWQTCPKGVSFGGSGMSVTTDAIARFGQLYLQKGVWNGTRILSEAWIDDASSAHVSNVGDPPDPDSDWQQGYGFQFWRCRHNCYRGDGAFGQYCVVIQERDMVVAITAAVSDMQAVLNLVWDHILPSAQSTARAEDPVALARLRDRLSSLVLPPPAGRAESTTVPKVSGKLYKRSTVEGYIETCRYDFSKGGCTLTMDGPNGPRTVEAGSHEWKRGVWIQQDMPTENIASRGAWISDNVYEIKLHYTEHPTGNTIRCEFVDDRVIMTMTLTSTFWPAKGPSFAGVLTASA